MRYVIQDSDVGIQVVQEEGMEKVALGFKEVMCFLGDIC
jgi:hypothetical protein